MEREEALLAWVQCQPDGPLTTRNTFPEYLSAECETLCWRMLEIVTNKQQDKETSSMQDAVASAHQEYTSVSRDISLNIMTSNSRSCGSETLDPQGHKYLELEFILDVAVRGSEGQVQREHMRKLSDHHNEELKRSVERLEKEISDASKCLNDEAYESENVCPNALLSSAASNKSTAQLSPSSLSSSDCDNDEIFETDRTFRDSSSSSFEGRLHDSSSLISENRTKILEQQLRETRNQHTALKTKSIKDEYEADAKQHQLAKEIQRKDFTINALEQRLAHISQDHSDLQDRFEVLEVEVQEASRFRKQVELLKKKLKAKEDDHQMTLQQHVLGWEQERYTYENEATAMKERLKCLELQLHECDEGQEDDGGENSKQSISSSNALASESLLHALSTVLDQSQTERQRMDQYLDFLRKLDGLSATPEGISGNEDIFENERRERDIINADLEALDAEIEAQHMEQLKDTQADASRDCALLMVTEKGVNMLLEDCIESHLECISSTRVARKALSNSFQLATQLVSEVESADCIVASMEKEHRVDLEQMQDQIEDRQDKLFKKGKEITSLHRELDEFVEESRVMEEKLTQLTKQNNTLEHHRVALQKELEVSNIRNVELEEDLNKSIAIADKRKETSERNALLEEQFVELVSNGQATMDQLNKLKQRNADLNEQLEDHMNKNKITTDQLNDVSGRKVVLEQQLEDLGETNRTTSDQLDEVIIRNVELEKELKDLCTEQEGAKATHRDMENMVKQLKEACAAAEDMKLRVCDELSEMQKQDASVKQQHNQAIALLESELCVSEKSLANSEQTVNSLRNELQEVAHNMRIVEIDTKKKSENLEIELKQVLNNAERDKQGAKIREAKLIAQHETTMRDKLAAAKERYNDIVRELKSAKENNSTLKSVVQQSGRRVEEHAVHISELMAELRSKDESVLEARHAAEDYSRRYSVSQVRCEKMEGLLGVREKEIELLQGGDRRRGDELPMASNYRNGIPTASKHRNSEPQVYTGTNSRTVLHTGSIGNSTPSVMGQNDDRCASETRSQTGAVSSESSNRSGNRNSDMECSEGGESMEAMQTAVRTKSQRQQQQQMPGSAESEWLALDAQTPQSDFA